MSQPSVHGRRATARDLLYFSRPSLWRTYPFLPVVRRPADPATLPECGVLYDARGMSGAWGYSATVFATNLFALPATEAALLTGPRHTYDTIDELADAGWCVD